MSESSARPLRAACTIVSPNYLAYARTLALSFRAEHPEQAFYVLIVAALENPTPFAAEPFEAILLPQLGLPNLRELGMMYEILELNTNVKPTFLKYLLARFGLDELVYLDPDIFCYAPLTPVFAALEEADALLTPHLTTPVMDGRQPGEQDMLYNGTYNLGFFAVRNTAGGRAVLDWWERRCLDLGFSEGRTGLFVDQKWMNLAPGLFERVAILRDPGLNMAYWNLHERRLTEGPQGLLVEGEQPAAPLRFFHFSGLLLNDAGSLSKNTDRFTLAGRPDLRELFAAYRASVLENRDAALESLPYGFDRLSDGTTVTRLARRLFAQHAAAFAGTDPFDATGPFAAFCRQERLVAGEAPPPKATWHEFSPRDRRVETVHRMLRFALRRLGPHRYELLMRYLAYIAVLRNQSVFLKPGR